MRAMLMRRLVARLVARLVEATLQGCLILLVASSVSAQSLSNYAIADWLTNLHGSPLCSGVVLGSISSTETADGLPPTLTFTMNFAYRRTEG